MSIQTNVAGQIVVLVRRTGAHLV